MAPLPPDIVVDTQANNYEPEKTAVCWLDDNDPLNKYGTFAMVSWPYGTARHSGERGISFMLSKPHVDKAPLICKFSDREDGVLVYFKWADEGEAKMIVYIAVSDLLELMSSKAKTYDDAAYFKSILLSHPAFLGFDGPPSNQPNFKLLAMLVNYWSKSIFFKALKIKSLAGYAKHLSLSWEQCINAVINPACLESVKAAAADHAKKDTDGKSTAKDENKEHLLEAKDSLLTITAEMDLSFQDRRAIIYAIHAWHVCAPLTS